MFWQNAGSTPYAASKSSGWFIDKIEAFRPFQMTGGSDGWKCECAGGCECDCECVSMCVRECVGV